MNIILTVIAIAEDVKTKIKHEEMILKVTAIAIQYNLIVNGKEQYNLNTKGEN